jgi:DNA-binding FadR family transcriptional regulator
MKFVMACYYYKAVRQVGRYTILNKFKVNRRNLSEQIADHLEQEILSPKYDLNDKLPSEQALSEEYQVSRPVIREALKLLTERGLVIQKNGNGAFVSKPDVKSIYKSFSRIISMDKIDSIEIHPIRLALEVESAGLASQNFKDDDVEELETILTKTENLNLSIMDRVKLDREFHTLIAKASGNRLLYMFISILMSLLNNYLAKGVVIQGGIEDGINRHRILLNAVKSRDSKIARKAMLDHLTQSKRNVENFDSSDHPENLKISDFYTD